LGGALEARGIRATWRELQSEAVGEVEADGRVLVIRRIHVVYRLKLSSDKRDAALRAHHAHVGNCPIARSIQGAIEVTTELLLEDE
jgi:organic hydroperoxide reductase OsmC/OhrA